MPFTREMFKYAPPHPSPSPLHVVCFFSHRSLQSTKIARAIVSSRPITTTKNLAEVVGVCAPPNERTKTLARVFQALRIKVRIIG